MSFWLSVMLFTLFIAFICFYPLLKSSTNSSLTRQTVKRDELNKALYFQRLAEIERDEAQGLLENATQVKTELQQTLLEDIPESVQQHENEQKTYGKIWFVSGLLALSILSLSAYLSVGAWQAEAMLEKTYQNYRTFTNA